MAKEAAGLVGEAEDTVGLDGGDAVEGEVVGRREAGVCEAILLRESESEEREEEREEKIELLFRHREWIFEE